MVVVWECGGVERGQVHWGRAAELQYRLPQFIHPLPREEEHGGCIDDCSTPLTASYLACHPLMFFSGQGVYELR